MLAIDSTKKILAMDGKNKPSPPGWWIEGWFLSNYY